MNLLDEWQMWMQAAGSAEKTITTRRHAMNALCSHAGLDSIESCTSRQALAWLANCRNDWTRQTYYSCLLAFYHWAEPNIGLEDITLKLPRPRSPKSVPRPVDWKIIERALLHPVSARANAYLTLAAFAGLRVSEVAAVHGEKIDLTDGLLWVKGKGGKLAALPMHPLIVRLAEGMPSHSFWFPGASDGHVGSVAVSQTLKRTLIAAGAARTVQAHQVRHSHCSELLDAGNNVRVVQELMRHGSLQTTQGYARVRDSSLRAAINGLRAA